MDQDRRTLDESAREPLIAPSGVSLEGVGRTFGKRVALSPVDVKIQAGEFVSLLGPSGSGKSTLLRIIAGLEKADRGVVKVGHSRKSFVFQEAALLPWRTVFANVRLVFEVDPSSRLAPVEADRRTREALALVGLLDSVDLFPNQLSGGMRMRVSVARAIASKPALLLLDEPFSALDEPSRHRLQSDLRTLWKTLGMTIVFVTHSVSEAVFVSDRAIVFSHGPGRIVLDHPIALPESRDANTRLSLDYLREIGEVNRAFAI